MSTQSGGTEPNVVVVKKGVGVLGGLVIFAGIAGVLCAGYLGLAAFNFLPSFFKNPFATTVTQDSGPILLESIRDASEFLAAEGSFQVVVTYEEDRQFIPSWLAGCKAIFVGNGDVQATVDVSQLAEDAIEISADGTEISITLPKPELSDVDSDVTESFVLAEERGVWDRFTGMFSSNPECASELQLLSYAEERISAVAQESGLIERAEANTEVWLRGLLRSLGYERVNITFTPNPA
jgi:hypothetical protein